MIVFILWRGLKVTGFFMKISNKAVDRMDHKIFLKFFAKKCIVLSKIN